MTAIPVLISLKSTAHREEAAEDERMSMLTSGTLEVDDTKAVIRYEESIDESLPPQPVEILVEEETVTMNRGGSYSTQMVFRLGCRYEGQYHTPFGDMDLALYCTRLGYDLGDDGGALELSYQLDINGKFAAMHDMELNLFKQGEGNASEK
ncbi:MAG: DUF1934 domain-containing protein [Clostridia bacterium]|nr:DUF1934 domain-containing protein [Clostridia bacterium]